jgi:predicted amidohydrolase YtcJ
MECQPSLLTCVYRRRGWARHFDDWGVLAPGKLADLVVLGTDLWQIDVDDLPDVQVDDVWIGAQALVTG